MENSEHGWGADHASPSDTLTPAEPTAMDHGASLEPVVHPAASSASELVASSELHTDLTHVGVDDEAIRRHAHTGVGDDFVLGAVQRQTLDGPPTPPDTIVAPERASRDWTRFRAEAVAGLQTLFSAAVYATLIVTFGFQVARVDGLSMAPTLEDQDRLIVNKMVYELGDPRPGDIVMLYYPLNPDKMFVKRVIANEGDVVRIVDGRVYVNDLPLHDDYVPEEFRSHDDWGPKVIDQGYYFVMGDHRNNSSDSRHWGLVPKKYIVGKVKVRFWPLHDARIF